MLWRSKVLNNKCAQIMTDLLVKTAFLALCNSTRARIIELLSDFHWHKTLRVSPIVCHFPFLPQQISEKTLGNFTDLLKIKPITWKVLWSVAAAPGSSLPVQHLPTSGQAACSMAPWAAGCITHAIRPHFLPSTHFPLPCLGFTPLFQSSRCPLSFSLPPTLLSF